MVSDNKTTQILVVEDEQIVAMDIRTTLERLGFSVPALAATGEAAIRHAEESQPDIVLMDIRLRGDMDGIEAARQIRSRCDIPVVYLTAQVDEQTIQRAKQTGPFAYILKPFEEKALQTAIEMALAKHEVELKLKESERELRKSRDELESRVQQLSEIEERTRLIIENALDAVITMDAEGKITAWNLQAENIFGWPADEVIGRALSETIIPAQFRDAHQRGLQTFLTTGTGPLLNRRVDDFMALHRDGHEIPVELSISPAKHAGSHLFSAFIRDITERKRARQRLERSEQKYRTLVETTQTGYLILDGDGTVADANSEYVRLSGHLTLQDILGRSVVQWTAEHDRERNAAEIKNCLEEGIVRNLEIDYIGPSGKITPIEINATVIETEKGPRILSLCRDITERHQAEEALKQSNADLDDYVHVVSHDLKDPLGMIMRHVQLLQRRHADKLGAAAEEHAAKIVQGAKNMESLINELYQNSKIGRGNVERVDCQSVLVEVLDELQPAIAECDGTVTQDQLPAVTANRIDVFQVFQNLTSNAIKFRADNRSLEIHVGCRHEGDKQFFWVRDNGIGIADQYHKRIFQIGERIGDKDVAGTGIGLANCKKAIERRGGKIWVQSHLGDGSTFFFTLPAS